MRKVFFFLCLVLCLRTQSQVNLTTGSATFSLPMFSWQDDKSRLNAVVALNYNSGNGLKVDDVASNVGQGWNLLAGGVITRMQVGEPDDQKPYVNGSSERVEDEYKYPAGFLYNSDINSYTKGCPLALKKYPLFEDKNHIYKQHNIVAKDRELDYFTFQFNGRSGTFVLQKNSNEGIFLGESKMKLTFLQTDGMTYKGQGIRTNISTFEITDENGLVYRFGKYTSAQLTYGLTKALTSSYSDASFVYKQTQPKIKRDKVFYQSAFDEITTNPYIISSWYLTEIEDILTGRKIMFNYGNINIQNEVCHINASAGNTIAYYTDKNYTVISHKITKTESPKFSSIIFPDQHQVTFAYQNETRFDYAGDYALASIAITYNGRNLSKYILNTTYFVKNRYGTPYTDYQKKYARLCLRSVKKIGVDLKSDDNPYIFDYYFGLTAQRDDYIPPPFCYAKDIYGFYNGTNSKAFSGDNIGGSNPNDLALDESISSIDTDESSGLCFRNGFYNSKKRNDGTDYAPNGTGYAQNGLLRQIVYPTGGSLTYYYEQNKASVSAGAQQDIGGVHVAKTSVADGGYSNPCDKQIETTYKYVLENSTNSSMWGLETPDNSVTTENGYSPEKKRFYWRPPLEFGCDYVFQYPGIVSREDKISVTALQTIMSVLSVVADIVSVISLVQDVATAIGASGVGAWVTVIIDVVTSLIGIALTCPFNVSKETSTTILYNFDLNSINPLPSQYSRVEVIPRTGDIGRTVYEFTSVSDYPLWDSYSSDPNERYMDQQSMKQRFAPWAYGLPKKTTVYDKQDASQYKVSETEYFYDWIKARLSVGKFSNNVGSCKCLVKKFVSQRSEYWISPLNDVAFETTAENFQKTSDDEMAVEPYYVYSGIVLLSSQKNRTFKPKSNLYSETLVEYENNPTNYQQKSITTTQSNGDKNTEYITYSCDYESVSSLFGQMVEANLLSLPVTTKTSFQRSNGSASGVLVEKVTEYTQLSNGDIKPYRILEQRFDQPQYNFIGYAGPGSTSNPPYKEIQYYVYNDGTLFNTYNYGKGNLIGIKDEGEHIVTNIYDYNDKYIVASVINADPAIDKPTYTSFETDKFGGWTLTGTAVYNTSAITGSRSLTLSTGKSLSAGSLNTSKAYIVSFWSASQLNVSSGTIVKFSPVINGFTYYEYKINKGASSVTISGNSNVDELRIYPETARMRTVTYDPLIGKTAESDENNRLTFYEYDEKARLKLIRDEKDNIVKMYEYNVVNKQVGCPTSFANRYISELFVKNDCSPDYIGVPVKYEIPAGTFVSDISQEDADGRAENMLQSNGQSYANTNGTCKRLWKNQFKSEVFYTQGCPLGFKGGAITYAVPANKYSSEISLDDANALAQDEIDANGQFNANVTQRTCVINNDPDFRGDENSRIICEIVNGQNTGHQLAELRDMNPNSPTYNQLAWKDVGVNTSQCPATIYKPLLIGTCSGINSSHTIYGNEGDVVVLKLTYSGMLQWNGNTSNGGAGASISITGAGQSCNNYTQHYTTTASTGFELTCTITITMPANYATINTSAVIHNSNISNAGGATLQVVSVNGVANSNGSAVCTGNSGGSW